MALEDLKIVIEQEKVPGLEVGLTDKLNLYITHPDAHVTVEPSKVRELLDALVLTLRAASMAHRRREEVKRGRDNQRNNRQVPDQGCPSSDQRPRDVRRN